MRIAVFADVTATVGWGGAGVLLLVLTFGPLLWSIASRRAYQGPQILIFARKPTFYTICGVVAAGGAALVGLTDDTNSQAWGIIAASVGLIVGLMYFSASFRFYVVDEQALTTRLLWARRALPWQEVDWAYPSSRTTRYRVNGIVPAGSSTREWLVVVAGPKRVISVPIRDTYLRLRGAPETFTRAITQRATIALFGYDQLPLVRQRRAALAPVRR
jgi:hypothetical protein